MNETNSGELFFEYHKRIEEFLKIDELNLKDVQMSLAATRHYWVGRLMYHKQKITKLKQTKEKALKILKVKLEEESPIGLSPKTVMHSLSQNETILKIDEDIVNNEFLVEYLTKVESNLRDSQHGLSNLTKIISLETT
jgi:hypothetical protein